MRSRFPRSFCSPTTILLRVVIHRPASRPKTHPWMGSSLRPRVCSCSAFPIEVINLRLPFQAIFVRLPLCRLEVSHAMTPRARRALFAVALFFAVCAVAGSFMQRKVGAQSSADESQLRDSLRSFTSVYAQVEENYAEPINGDRADTAIYDGAIPD